MSEMVQSPAQQMPSGNPRLTFAIPYRSRPKYLTEALDSVLAQTNPHWLLHIYDDNPEQPVDRAMLAPYLEDGRISYSANETQLGIGQNWNQCFDRCSTELLTILHADDCLLPNYLQLMLDVFDRDDSAWAVFCQAQIMDEEGRPAWSFADHVKRYLRPGATRYLLAGEAGANALLRGNFIMCPTLCYRVRSIGDRRFDGNWKMVLDLDFYLRLLMDGGLLCGSSELAYRYRRHAGSETSVLSGNLQRFEEEAALYRQYAEVLERRGWNAAAATARRCRVIKLHLAYRAVLDLLALRWGGVSEKMELMRRV